MSSPGTKQFLFTEVVPGQPRRERELSNARARSHAARVSHNSRWRTTPVAKVTVGFEHGKRSLQRSVKAIKNSSSSIPLSRSHETPSATASPHQDRGASQLKLGLPRLKTVDLNLYPVEKTAAGKFPVYAKDCSVLSRAIVLFPSTMGQANGDSQFRLRCNIVRSFRVSLAP